MLQALHLRPRRLGVRGAHRLCTLCRRLSLLLVAVRLQQRSQRLRLGGERRVEWILHGVATSGTKEGERARVQRSAMSKTRQKAHPRNERNGTTHLCSLVP